ncbi:hypothetical protein Pla108_28670 [Botrimarina colliarenosi]|uniref:PEP-CTERM protein-sorting domain-containing protein n=1 Tax=Botrimarina colliarenosi TaxID=2528001 RepID=A0A5C6ACE7_9BACT|nr:hypothetical protein [Botrimarina colliarenosi]TWT97090.1 hypothetical protein Pla108_28670 [Botrimarina colliarenosi]
MNQLRCQVAFALFATLAATHSAQAVLGHFEGFEDPSWTAGGDNWNDNAGTITRATSGTAGITSSSGGAHAVLSGGGPFTRFGGYSSNFDGGFIASLDVYIDPAAFSPSEGFDYSVAVSNQSGSHLRDFIWHVGMDGSDLKVNASNNTDAVFNAFKLNNENGGNNFTITGAGWYTFEQNFYNDGGALAVDFNLYDDGGSALYSVTRSNAGDDIASIVGGNRYGWFTYNDIAGLAIDNTSLAAIPEPALAGVWALGAAVAGVRYRRRRNADN